MSARINSRSNSINYDRALWFAAIISYLLLLFSNVRYAFGRRSPWDPDHQDDVAFTPFTANIFGIFAFFAVSGLLQLIYLGQHFYNSPRLFNLVFIVNNFISLMWSYLFARGHFFLSEVLAITNFVILLAVYLFGQSYTVRPLSTWLAVNGSVVVMPMVWNHYLVYWNGAVLVGAKHLLARIIANVFIWEFLISPSMLMLITGDYFLGFSNAYLVGAIGLGQLFTRVFALQWIFAFVIMGCLISLAMFFAFVRPPPNFPRPQGQEISENGETAPLLTDV